ncbi:hypothetical protein BpHYR1_027508 [Brachionus plicatilis]|uniref:Uncharacterized protein n=1 Tax=Brachionus plicatilis TaxID=10195 RepID=A0A3M7RZ51_BRAPC|nr:hypothetical protein BpHYR1_027508 [Brachionus plicatilis]
MNKSSPKNQQSMSKLKKRNVGESFFSVIRVRNPKFLILERLRSPKERSVRQKLKVLELRSQLRVKERKILSLKTVCPCFSKKQFFEVFN